MNTDKRERPLRGAGMAVRLWAIMMVLVLLTVGFTALRTASAVRPGASCLRGGAADCGA